MKPKQFVITNLLAVLTIVLAACATPAASPTLPPPTETAVPPTAAPEPTSTPVPVPDALTVVQAFFEADKAQDIEAVLALMVDNVRFRGSPTMTGKDSARAYYQASYDVGYTSEYSNIRVTKGRVTYEWRAFRNETFQAGGEDVIVVENGLITTFEGYSLMGGSSRPDIPEAAFTASDSAFSGPTDIKGGWAKITLTNEGTEGHHIQLVKLDEGKTPDNLLAALTADGENYPAWAVPYGGPNAPDPGATLSSIVFLPAGSYALIDLIPNADAVPHFANGLITGLTVTENNGVPSAEPLPNLTIDLANFTFAVATAPVAGEQFIRFRNLGSQPHEAYIVKLAEGKTADDYLNTPAGEVPPGIGVGGITGIAPGDNQYISLNLEPGNYAMFCFLPDPETHAPHFVHGMIYEFTVP